MADLVSVVVHSLASKVPDAVGELVLLLVYGHHPLLDVNAICDWLVVVHVRSVLRVDQRTHKAVEDKTKSNRDGF